MSIRNFIMANLHRYENLFPTYYSLFNCSKFYAQTSVSGAIYADATWSKSGSPYTVKDSVVIFDNVTLTIDAGVVVIFDRGATMRLRGNLSAIGNKSDSIRFTGAIKTMGSWEGIFVTSKNLSANAHQVTMDYCIGEYATRFIDLLYAERGPYTFTHCSFYNNNEINRPNNTVPVTGLIFDSCFFEKNDRTVYGIGGSKDAIISNCIFLNNSEGPYGGIIDKCVGIGNTIFGGYLYTSITKSYSIITILASVLICITKLLYNTTRSIVITSAFPSTDFGRILILFYSTTKYATTTLST